MNSNDMAPVAAGETHESEENAITTESRMPAIDPAAGETGSTSRHDVEAAMASLERLQLQPLSGLSPAGPCQLRWTDPTNSCYNFRKRKNGFHPYLAVEGGIHLPIRKFSLRNAEDADYLADRSKTESVLEGWSGSFLLGMESRQGWLVEAGLGWERINEKFHQVDTLNEQIGMVIVTTIIINAPGDTTFIQETKPINRTTITSRTIYSRYSLWQLPLAVGYQWKTESPWTPFLKAGVQLNLTAEQRVGMLDPAGQVHVYESAQAGSDPSYPFRQKLGISPFIQVGAAYRLLPQLDAYGEIRYLMHGSSFTEDSFPLEQRYQSLGLQLGMKWRM